MTAVNDDTAEEARPDGSEYELTWGKLAILEGYLDRIEKLGRSTATGEVDGVLRLAPVALGEAKRLLAGWERTWNIWLETYRARQAAESALTDAIARAERAEAALANPVPMFLTCPACSERHIDEGEFATKPHHTHACQGCGLTWRPAVVATVGVRFLPGFKNETAPLSPPSRSDISPILPTVPRDHCHRCDRCGFPLAVEAREGCTPGNCSMRPLPELRTTCAGCGAPLEAPGT